MFEAVGAFEERNPRQRGGKHEIRIHPFACGLVQLCHWRVVLEKKRQDETEHMALQMCGWKRICEALNIRSTAGCIRICIDSEMLGPARGPIGCAEQRCGEFRTDGRACVDECVWTSVSEWTVSRVLNHNQGNRHSHNSNNN